MLVVENKEENQLNVDMIKKEHKVYTP